MDNENFFSIITPLRNGRPFIDSYLESLLSQTFRNWEVIIVDDDSNDNSIDLIKRKIKGDSRFNFLKVNIKKNINGPYLARNIALDASKGKYVCFLDVDDYWLPNKLSNQKKIIKSNNQIKLIFSSYYRCNFNKQKYTIRKPLIIKDLKTTLKFINPIPMVDACLLRECIGNIKFQPINHEDYLFWQEVVEKIPENNIYIDDKINSIYRLNNISISSSKIKVINWIWQIYKINHKSKFFNILKIVIRFLLQVIIKIKEKSITLNKKNFLVKNLKI